MVLVRGDTGAFKFQRLDSSGEAITTTPTAIYFTVKKSYSHADDIFQKTLSDMTMDEDGTWHFTINPVDTASLDYGQYVFDLEVTTDDYVQTIAKGKLLLEEEATWVGNK